MQAKKIKTGEGGEGREGVASKSSHPTSFCASVAESSQRVESATGGFVDGSRPSGVAGPVSTAYKTNAQSHLPHDSLHAAGELHHHHSHAAVSAHAGGHHLLNVEGLSVSFAMYDSRAGALSSARVDSRAIHDLDLSIHVGEVLAVVGASGAGKSVLADALLGLYAQNAKVEGTIYFDGVLQDAQSLVELRGREVAYIPQSIAALDPMMRVGRQIGSTPDARRELYRRYNLPSQLETMYPHELSGGMARRALLLTALVQNPRLIVADEPTPGLDLPLAVYAMQDFRAFADAGGSVLLITHDIQLALKVADRIAVFNDGTVIEETSVANFAAPELLREPFTKALWHALPEHDFATNSIAEGKEDPNLGACAVAESTCGSRGRHILEAVKVSFDYSKNKIIRHAQSVSSVDASSTDALNAGGVKAIISNVDFALASGERVAICGPSGRGKSTFCKLLAGYLEPASGQILLDGRPAWGRHGAAVARKGGLGDVAAGAARIQLISQHPEAALDPRMRVGKTLAEAGLKMRDDVPQMLGIDPDWERRFPLELSGGQLQRICIARAVASNPDFLIADEISTMLDALTQAQIWDFLLSWQEKTGAGLVFVSHSPALTERLATRTFDI